MTHIMLDIETTGTKPGCRILSVGACTFDIGSDIQSAKTFYGTIDPESYSDYQDDQSTLDWWDSQGEAVRNEAFSGTKPHDVVFNEFGNFIRTNKPRTIWCKGASFDFPILNYWTTLPVAFWKQRCARTYLAAADVNSAREIAKLNGDAHNALDDSLGQAVAMQKAAAILGQLTFK